MLKRLILVALAGALAACSSTPETTAHSAPIVVLKLDELMDSLLNLNKYSGLISALVSFALLVVTGVYAWITKRLLEEAKATRLLNSTPEVVAYLRIHDVHSNLVQLHVSNLAQAPAKNVSVSLSRKTEWPEKFGLEGSNRLRDIRFLGPGETLKFDLGEGPDLFRDKQAAEFLAEVKFAGLDGRNFDFKTDLDVGCLLPGGNGVIYGLDYIGRRLKEISKTLEKVTGSKYLNVELRPSSSQGKIGKVRKSSPRSWKSSFRKD